MINVNKKKGQHRTSYPLSLKNRNMESPNDWMDYSIIYPGVKKKAGDWSPLVNEQFLVMKTTRNKTFGFILDLHFINIVNSGKGAGQKMFPNNILGETSPPTMKKNRQACSPSFDVKGGDRSLHAGFTSIQLGLSIVKRTDGGPLFEKASRMLIRDCFPVLFIRFGNSAGGQD